MYERRIDTFQLFLLTKCSHVSVSKFFFLRSISRGVYRLSQTTFATQASKMWSFRMINVASGLFFLLLWFDFFYLLVDIYLRCFQFIDVKSPHMDLKLEPVNDKYATCLPRHFFAPFTNQQFWKRLNWRKLSHVIKNYSPLHMCSAQLRSHNDRIVKK